MKKAIKIIAVISVLAMLCCLMCSCKQLDEMKSRQAFWADDDKNFSLISYDGKLYKKIPQTLTLHSYSIANEDNISITTSDVPVLLKNEYGDYGFIDDQKRLITRETDYSSSGSIYYCREDLYDDVVKSLENKEFGYYVANTYSGNIVLLSKETADAINDILDTVKPEESLNCSYDLILYDCDKFGLFTCPEANSYSISLGKKSDGTYYIYKEEYPEYPDDEDEPTIKRYIVPDKYKKLIGDVYKKYYTDIYVDVDYEY